MYQAVPVMKTLNVIGVIVAVTIIALAGIAIVAAAAAYYWFNQQVLLLM
jgi:hypothetical protein